MISEISTSLLVNGGSMTVMDDAPPEASGVRSDDEMILEGEESIPVSIAVGRGRLVKDKNMSEVKIAELCELGEKTGGSVVGDCKG